MNDQGSKRQQSGEEKPLERAHADIEAAGEPSEGPSPVPETEEGVVKRFLQVARAFVGPVPPPDLLRQYEEISPGFADRLIQMAEAQQNHRHQLEQQHLDGYIRDKEAARKEARLG